MKKQTGIWVDAQSWQAYRDICSREKLRPAEPIERFIRFILRDGSALPVMNWLENAERAEGLEAYARVLLNWYKNGTYWTNVTDACMQIDRGYKYNLWREEKYEETCHHRNRPRNLANSERNGLKYQ